MCRHSEDMYGHFEEAVESVLEQTYDDIELVLISDEMRQFINECRRTMATDRIRPSYWI